jgi:hypothetical protein
VLTGTAENIMPRAAIEVTRFFIFSALLLKPAKFLKLFKNQVHILYTC